MYQLRFTEAFEEWIRNLRDRKGRARIIKRLDAAYLGNLGDVKAVGHGVREMRVHFGPGYRIYFAQREKVLLIILCGGDKSTQARDIAMAQRILKDYDEE
jgi:putative addiction module killer protein